MGKLLLSIMKCRDLKAADFNNKSDPFVRISIPEATGFEARQTKVVNDTLNPTFDETFEIDGDYVNANNSLMLEVFDKDTFGADPIGVYLLPFESMRHRVRKSGWYPLLNAEMGQIEIAVEPLEGFAEPEEVPLSPRSSNNQKSLTRTKIESALSDTFSPLLINEIFEMFVRADADGSRSISRGEMVSFLQEVYFYTGTPVPSDDSLNDNVKQLMRTYDKDQNASLDALEFCDMMKSSHLAGSLKSKWKSKDMMKAKDTVSASRAGAGWKADPPAPNSYAGFRQADGRIMQRTRPPNFTDGVSEYNGATPIENQTLEKVVVNGVDITGCKLRYCHLVGCTIKSSSVDGGIVEACSVSEGSSLQRLKALRSTLVSNCRVAMCGAVCDCQLVQCEIPESDLMQTTAEECKITSGSFAQCAFINCTIEVAKDEGGNMLQACDLKR